MYQRTLLLQGLTVFFFIVPHRSLFRSKNRSDSFPKTNSSRSSSVASGGDSGIDDDLNRSGRYHQP